RACYLCFTMLRLLSRPTLFPYTTLFRSEFTVLLYEFKHDVAAYLSGLTHTSMRTLADLIEFNATHVDQEMPWFGQELFELSETLDRKSTRLNSSHVSISYAVFCLKKKKK